jgi:hypothetical protein
VRADFPRLFDVDFEILQNPAVKLSSSQAYLPYWPIPGQIERRSTRHGLQTIAYAGFIGPRNLASQIKNGGWCIEGLRGLDFVVVPPDKWHDMSEIDLLVAVRSLDRRTYSQKPPSKLFNAWRSSIPLVAGFDSAFSTVGRPGNDYVRVGSLEEFTQAIVRFRDDPRHYDRIVANGRRQAVEVSHEKLAWYWLHIFDREIEPHYQSWLHRDGPTKRRAVAQSVDRARNLASALKARFLPRLSLRVEKPLP